MQLSDFDYHLPIDRIAQTPLESRDHSRLLVIDRATNRFGDHHFYDLPKLLTDNDVLILNNTRVFPARLFATRLDSKSQKPIELLLEKELSLTQETISWEALTKPGLKVGDRLSIPNTHVTALCTAVNDYTRTLTFSTSREHFFTLLHKWAKTPIPPYIKWESKDEESLKDRYQTVYASRLGAVAAPTAGLHFTPYLLNKIKTCGIQVEELTLHVGLGTFLPVKTQDITKHAMHSEWFELSQPTSSRLKEAKRQGKRLIAVGTTAVRVLESTLLEPASSTTSIYIYPPYKFKATDSLITNFHTPKSTLLMLVCALTSSPNTPAPFVNFSSSLMGKAYAYALENNYRFYSFGDAMWIK